MDPIVSEKALHLRPPCHQLIPSPVPSQPFPFLKLPCEIRDSMYHYALLYDWAGPGVISNRCYFNRRGGLPLPLDDSLRYWGSERSTRLFRVNHQVSHEALELFYSTYFFYFPTQNSISLVVATVRDILTPGARSLIRNISFHVDLYESHRLAFIPAREEERRQGFAAAVKMLPNVKRVELTLSFLDKTVPDYEVKKVVAIALKTLSPLKHYTGLVLKEGRTNKSAQWTRIIREVREALGCL